MIHEIKLPAMSEDNETKATVSFWYAQVGQSVKKDEDVVELLTDKAAFNVGAPADGVLKEIRFEEGSQCSAGEVLAIIESD